MKTFDGAQFNEERGRANQEREVQVRTLRREIQESGVFVASLFSSPAASQSEFLERTLSALQWNRRVAALVEQSGRAESVKTASRGRIPVRQISSATPQRLPMEQSLEGWDLDELDFLFIELEIARDTTVPLDLGEDLHVAVFCVDGEAGFPMQHRLIFQTADLAVLIRSGPSGREKLLAREARQNVHAVRAGIPVLEVSPRTGAGLRSWLNVLESRAIDHLISLERPALESVHAGVV